MTREEFGKIRFGINDKVKCYNVWYDVRGVDFEQDLVAIKDAYDMLHWVRCEYIEDYRNGDKKKETFEKIAKLTEEEKMSIVQYLFDDADKVLKSVDKWLKHNLS